MKSSDDMTKTKSHILQRHNLADAVVSKLQQQLSLGEYQPGEKLPSEPELMAQFGVGRSTIREAIRILANTGLISVRQGSGTYAEVQDGISEPLTQRLKRASKPDLDEVRCLLEVKIAEKAALNRTQKDIEKMKTFLQKRIEAAIAGDIEGAIRNDIQFHISIAAASHNDILADLYKTFADHQINKHFHETFKDAATFISSQKLHESLLNSIIDQDQKKAIYWTTKNTKPV